MKLLVSFLLTSWLMLGAALAQGSPICQNNPNDLGPPNFTADCPLTSKGLNKTAPVSAVSPCPSITLYGGVADGKTDTIPAWNSAAQAVQCVSFPTGAYYFSTGITISGSTAGQSLGIQGVGSDLVKLRFDGGSGIVVNYFNKTNSAHLSGFTCLSVSGGGTCITLNRTTSDTGVSLDSPPSMLTDLVIGYDTPGHDWANCIVVNGVSVVNYQITCNNSPQGGYGGTVNGIVLTGTVANPSVVHNVYGSNFNWGASGIVMNAYVEGVTVTGGTNFTLGNRGIFTPTAQPNNYYQLSVSDSQFNNGIAGIDEESGVYNTNIHDNIFILPASSTGVLLQSGNYAIIRGNQFNATTAAPNSSNTGVNIVTSLASPAPINLVSGNQFGALSTGIKLGTGTSGNVIDGNNLFINNTTDINNLGSVNITGANIIQNIVTGSPPTVASGAGDCGTSPFFGSGSNDQRGNIIVGSGANGNKCTVTFSSPSGMTPFCQVQDVTNPAVIMAAQGTTTAGFVAITTGNAISGAANLGAADHLAYQCNGIYQ